MSSKPTRQQRIARDDANRDAKARATRANQHRQAGREAEAKFQARAADAAAARAVAAQRAIDRDPSS